MPLLIDFLCCARFKKNEILKKKDDPWGVVRSRALEAGRLLAAVLLSRPVGSRPVTLLGYSMGAKVIAWVLGKAT